MYWNVWVLTTFRVGGRWGGVIDGGFLGGCQRLHWEIWSGCHSGGCWLHTRHECKIFQPCSDGPLSCDGVRPALRCQWGQRNAPVPEGAAQNWTCGYCYGTPRARCNVWGIAFQSVRRMLCCNLSRFICTPPIVRTYRGRVLLSEQVPYGVVCPECYLEVCSPEYVCDV